MSRKVTRNSTPIEDVAQIYPTNESYVFVKAFRPEERTHDKRK